MNHLGKDNTLLASNTSPPDGTCCRNADGFSQTVAVIGDRYAEITKLLVNGQPHVDKRDEKGRTALHLAARDGYEEMVSFLLSSSGCDLINAPDNAGATSLSLALGKSHVDVALLLLSHNASCHVTGNTLPPLLMAVVDRQVALLAVMLDQGADVDRRVCNGMTALNVLPRQMSRFEAGTLEYMSDLKTFHKVTSLLVQHGANPIIPINVTVVANEVQSVFYDLMGQTASETDESSGEHSLDIYLVDYAIEQQCSLMLNVFIVGQLECKSRLLEWCCGQMDEELIQGLMELIGPQCFRGLWDLYTNPRSLRVISRDSIRRNLLNNRRKDASLVAQVRSMGLPRLLENCLTLRELECNVDYRGLVEGLGGIVAEEYLA